ncbi:MAG TPA: hypothetical protein VGK01_11905 [Candidatus Angelobacter sp.]
MPRKRINPKRPRFIRGRKVLSEFPGVTYEKAEDRQLKPWKAYVIQDGKHITLGRYTDEGSACMAVQDYHNEDHGATHGN